MTRLQLTLTLALCLAARVHAQTPADVPPPPPPVADATLPGPPPPPPAEAQAVAAPAEAPAATAAAVPNPAAPAVGVAPPVGAAPPNGTMPPNAAAPPVGAAPPNAAAPPNGAMPAQAVPPGGPTPPPPVAGAAPVPGQIVPVPTSGAPAPGTEGLSQLEGFLEPFIYDIVNRRDPFQPYAEYVPSDEGTGRALSPAQRWDLEKLKLIGIMWDIKDPKSMFLDPDGDVMILGRDESIGNKNGYIAAIREGEVVVVEALRKRGDVSYRTRMLRIER